MKPMKPIFPMLSIGILMSAMSVLALAQDEISTTPTQNNGERWRISYYQGGDYIDYYKSLSALIGGLMELGWLEHAAIPKQEDEDTQLLWEWLSKNASSPYIEFVDDGYYNGGWDDAKRDSLRNDITERLVQEDDIDLLIAMGTWAGQDLANNKHTTPTMVVSTSDPVGAKIIKSIDDSGYDHVHAHADPLLYERQIRLFHEMVDFKRLGVAYEDSLAGRSNAAIDMIEKLGHELGFDIVRCYVEMDVSDQELADQTVPDCYQKLVEQADAIYVTVQAG